MVGTPRSSNCPLAIHAGPPPVPVTNIAIVRCVGLRSDHRDCYDEIRREACVLGADTVYGVHEELARRYGSDLVATVARRSAQP